MNIAYKIADWWLRDKDADKKAEVVKKERRKEDMRIAELLDRLEEQEDQLREQLDLYDTLLNGVPVMIWYIEGVDKMGICNKTCADFFGLERPDQLAGMSLYQMMPEEEASVCVENNRRVFEEYQTVESEEWVTRHDGVQRLWKITKTPRGNGHVEYAVCCGVDITELREAELKNQAMLSAIPDLMFINDAEGNYLDYHATEPEMLAASPNVILSRNLCEILEPGDAKRCFDAFAKAMETRELQTLEYELEIAGEKRRFEARIVPLNGSRLLSIIRDITGIRRGWENLAKQLMWQQEKLRSIHPDCAECGGTMTGRDAQQE